MAHLTKFRELGCRVLIGISRKSIIGKILNNKVEERLNGTVITNTIGVMTGADIIRVHDVAEHVELKKILAAVFSEGAGHGAS